MGKNKSNSSPPPPTHTHNYFGFVHVLCLTLRNQNNEEDLSGNSSALEVLYSLYGFANNQRRSITHGGLVLYSQVMGNESTHGQEMVPIPGPVSLFWMFRQTHVAESCISSWTPSSGCQQNSKDIRFSFPLLTWIQDLLYLGWELFMNLLSFWGQVIYGVWLFLSEPKLHLNILTPSTKNHGLFYFLF